MHAWLENQIGQSAANIITSLIVLIIVIAAIAITISLLRKFNSGTFVVGGKSRTPRLSVRDAAAVDRTRRLVLVRRDNVEHLLMIGGPTDLVIETNIKIGDPAERREDPAIAEMNLGQNARPTPGYRETTLTKPSTPIASRPISPNRPISPDERLAAHYSKAKINPTSDEPNVAPTTNGARRAPELDIPPATDKVALNRNVQSPLSTPNEPSIADFVPSQSNNISSRPAKQPYISPDFRPTLKDSAVSAEIEGRREPALEDSRKNTDTSVELDDDFDHMFENELSNAIKNEKIKP